MKISTWNVNSLKVRLPQVLEWLKTARPDVLCIQETKLRDEHFPADEFEALGYVCAFAGQKTYNGVATVSRSAIEQVETDLPGLEDPQRRVLSTMIDGLRVLNLYVPNGQEVGSEKYEYKLKWLEHLVAYAKALLSTHDRVVICGDFNIAPEDRDVHDPEAWRGRVLCSEPEREAFKALMSVGFRVSKIRSAGRSLLLVGLPRRGVPPQHGPAHRPYPVQRAPVRRPRVVHHRCRTAPSRAAFRPRAGGRRDQGAGHRLIRDDRRPRGVHEASTICGPGNPGRVYS